MKEKQMDKCILAIMNKLDSLSKSIFNLTLVITKNQKELGKLISASNQGKGYNATIRTLKEKDANSSKGEENG